MFDLESALAAWRRRLKARGAGDPLKLDEMEDHLREAFAAFQGEGLDEEAAWDAASAKFGDPQAVGREFAKIERLSGMDRMAFGAISVAAIVATGALIALAVSRRGRLSADPLLLVHVVAITFAYIAGLAAASIAGYTAIKRFVMPDSSPRLAGAALPWMRNASLVVAVLTVIGFVLGAFWAKDHLGRAVDLTDLRESGALTVIACFAGLYWAARWKSLSAENAMTMAILGGGLILAAWLVPARADGYTAPRLVGFGGLAASVILAALSLKPRSPQKN